jgi:hypothetical protein
MTDLDGDDAVRTTVWSVDRRPRGRAAASLARRFVREKPDLVIMEGTGVVGGSAVLAARILGKTPFIVSSGDAVAAYLSAEHRAVALPAALYERLLCRLCHGYVGWTPYLVGRALTFGAPRAMTAAGWGFAPAKVDARAAMRERWGIPAGDVVIGIVGSLRWNHRHQYCYGLELIRAAAGVKRRDLTLLIVGEGDGLKRLRENVADSGPRVVFGGPLDRAEIPAALAAIDIASLPQSLDRVGSFRFSTKLPEYLCAGLPVVTGQLPFSYDLDGGWLIRLPGSAPWDPRYVRALRGQMQSISHEQIAQMRTEVPRGQRIFDRGEQSRALRSFVLDILAATGT